MLNPQEAGREGHTDFIQEKSALEVDEIHVGKETMEMLGLLGMAGHVESFDVLDCSIRSPAGLLNGKEAPTTVNHCPNMLSYTSQVLLPIKDVNRYPIPEIRRVKTLLGAEFGSYFIHMSM
jgi:hypothetical protein